jgi:hypothetical protein
MKISIQCDADFTPKGKRRVKIVATNRGGRQLRWYVGNSIFRFLTVTNENIELSQAWKAA